MADPWRILKRLTHPLDGTKRFTVEVDPVTLRTAFNGLELWMEARNKEIDAGHKARIPPVIEDLFAQICEPMAPPDLSSPENVEKFLEGR